jgi:DNA-binding NarL/FixJ family response regulator
MEHGEKGVRRRAAAAGSALCRKLFAVLTPRQREIALLVGGGARNKDVAARLNISEKTVKAHLGVVFIKTRLYDRTGLARVVGKYSPNGSRPAAR